MGNKLSEGLELLGIDAGNGRLQLLESYIAELEFWNRKMNLVSVENHEQLVVRHVLDCLAGLNVIEKLEGKRIGDIGSGAGLPGLLLAVFLEDRHITLVERSGKKAGFLRSTASLLKLVDRVDIVNTDLNQINTEFDIVTLRAFRDFSDFYNSLKRITAPNGLIAAYKGRKETITEELSSTGIGRAEVETVPLSVPFLDEERHMMLVRPEL